MEDFIVTWDIFMSTRDSWDFKTLEVSLFEERIPQNKRSKLDLPYISREMSDLRAKTEEIFISNDLVSVLYEEYFKLNQNMKSIKKEVDDQIQSEYEMDAK